MERRRKRQSAHATHNLDHTVDAKGPAVAPGDFPNLARLIAHGQITLGVIRPMGCVAVAHDGHNSLATLHRRRGETLLQLLTRLEFAVDQAVTEEVFTDEINPAS